MSQFREAQRYRKNWAWVTQLILKWLVIKHNFIVNVRHISLPQTILKPWHLSWRIRKVWESNKKCMWWSKLCTTFLWYHLWYCTWGNRKLLTKVDVNSGGRTCINIFHSNRHWGVFFSKSLARHSWDADGEIVNTKLSVNSGRKDRKIPLVL